MNTFGVKVVTNRKKYLKRLFTQVFRREKQLVNRLKIIEKYKRSVKLNKPTQIRATILELRKVLMYDFYYNYIRYYYMIKLN